MKRVFGKKGGRGLFKVERGGLFKVGKSGLFNKSKIKWGKRPIEF